MAGLSAGADGAGACAGAALRAPAAALAALLLAGGAAAASAGPGGAAGLCRAGEQPLFTCPLAGRTLSVCASRSGAVYRWGRPGRIVREIAGGRFARAAFSGGGEAQLQFDRAGERRIVFSRIVRTGFGPEGHNDPQAESGLVVLRGGRVARRHDCAAAGTMDEPASARLPEADFVAH